MFVIVFTLISALSFLYYGAICLTAPWMVLEFKRYGLSEGLRKLTGVLQLLGSLGLLIGLKSPLLGFIAAAGLSLLMLLGFLTRLKIRDTFLQSLPSFIFMLLNAYLAFVYAGYWLHGAPS
jgi:hypothetical protein